MKKIKIIYLLFFASLMAACSHIDEADQLIYVAPDIVEECPPNSALRNVLLEDFTGQQCVNCPRGTKVIEQLQEAYADRLIAVGIHGGPLGFKGNAAAIGLATDLGDTYYNHWQLEYQPVGLVDRHGAVNYTDWFTAVREELAKPSKVSMQAEASISNGQVSVSIKTECLDGTYNGMLQVWLLEDGITATQKRHDPIDNDNTTINDKNYLHNHVLRTAVNGTWGEALSVAANEPVTKSYQLPLDAAWVSTNLSIVAFVYNDSGVEQATKTIITIKE